jgi:hypothetical protein
MLITEIEPAEFRRRLAGLSDSGGGEDLAPGVYRDIASDMVLLCAICFNRDQLDATTLWTRIDSGIERGLAECGGEDVERFVDVCLQHVLASANVVAANEKALEIQDRIYSLGDSKRVMFLRYLAEHRMPSLVFGRKKWIEFSAERKAVAK